MFEDIFQPWSEKEIKERGLDALEFLPILDTRVNDNYPQFRIHSQSAYGFELFQCDDYIEDVSPGKLNDLRELVEEFLKDRKFVIKKIMKREAFKRLGDKDYYIFVYEIEPKR